MLLVNPIFEAARTLIAASLQAQKKYATTHPLGRIVHARELATVRVGGPRQSGHTTAAGRLARETFAGHKCLIVVPDAGRLSHLSDAVRREFAIVSTLSGLGDVDRFRGVSLHAIVVDGVTEIGSEDLDSYVYRTEVLNLFSNQETYHIVLLG